MLTQEFVLVFGYHQGEAVGEALFAYLKQAGIGFRALSQDDCQQKIATLVADYLAEPTAFDFVPQADDLAYRTKEDQEPVLLFCHFSKDRLGEVLIELKQNGATPLPLKAALTDNNHQWAFAQLGVELGIEHRFMNFYIQVRQTLEMTKDLEEASYTPASWAQLTLAKAEAEAFVDRVGKEEIPPEEAQARLEALLNAYFALVTAGDEDSP